MKTGQLYFIIDAKWWDLWKEYVKYDIEGDENRVITY